MTTGNNKGEIHIPSGRVPTTGTFIVLLVTLWALNLADTFQTLYLKESGFLAKEANYFIDYFLSEGRAEFLGAKILALILVSSILGRGWFDRRGCTLGGHCWELPLVRRAIILLLSAGVIYYIIIVAFPFFALTISGLFNPPA
jgi:hypothetical protein